MKKNILRNTIIAGALSTVLVVPSLAQNANILPISTKDVEIIPISYKFDHWAEIHKEKLLSSYDVESIFKDKDFNAAITLEDFKNLVKLSINQEYDKGKMKSLGKLLFMNLLKYGQKKQAKI